jgi:histidinol-phosphatase (PHP family)
MAALPPDGHVHTEWSWDTTAGSMERSCARAVGLGLPSVAFTDHCRDKFPGLRILSGAELGEPHWHPDQVRAVLGSSPTPLGWPRPRATGPAATRTTCGDALA